MFLWLGLALFVDGIDGPMARKLQVKSVLPTWSGDMLDNVIDYVTYVLIPAFALYNRGFMGEGLSFLSAAIIVISSAVYYADTSMKTKENFFKGFPVVWNMLVFTLFIIEPGEWTSFAAVVFSAVLTFLPINFLHPVRVKRLREINLPVDIAPQQARRGPVVPIEALQRGLQVAVGHVAGDVGHQAIGVLAGKLAGARVSVFGVRAPRLLLEPGRVGLRVR